MAVPVVLTRGGANGARASLRAKVQSTQSSRGAGSRFRQVRARNVADRAAVDPGREHDGLDWHVDEYESPLGRGWVLQVIYEVDAADTDSGSDETWWFTHHVGPEPGHDDEWALEPPPRVS